VVCAHPARDIDWIADAHRGDEKRFVVRADEKLAFVELELVIRSCPRSGLNKLARFYQDSASLNGS
jgi:hypothetical protein